MANKNPDTSGLVSLADRPNNERTKIQSAGGIASGISRREKVKMRQIFMDALALPHENCQNMKEAMAIAMITRALKGDVKAFELIMRFIGEKPTELQEVTTDDDFDFLF